VSGVRFSVGTPLIKNERIIIMIKYNYYETNKTVVCVAFYAGKPVKGIAKCNPEDKFDVETGKELARRRCAAKIAKKKAKYAADKYYAARATYQKAKAELEDMSSFMNKTANDMISGLEDLEKYEKELSTGNPDN
jgi:thioredoxin-like negative regulator of GroEL